MIKSKEPREDRFKCWEVRTGLCT